MILSSHVAIGATIGTIVKDPVIGFFAGLVSHHIADLIPHTDIGSYGGSIYNLFKKKKFLLLFIADVLLSLLILVPTLLYFDKNVVIFSLVGAILPDVIDNSPFWSPQLRKLFPFNYYHLFHERFHNTVSDRFWLGYLTQLLLIIVCILIIINQ